jgi:anthranilate synthase component 1
VRRIERLPTDKPDTLELPETFFLFARNLLVFDHVKHKILIISNAFIDKDAAIAYDAALEAINELEDQLLEPLAAEPIQLSTQSKVPEFESNFSKEQFCKAVETAKEYIRAGDIFQVVPSQRFSIKLEDKPFNIYRKLRIINPSPYMFFIDMGDFQLVGSSPEILVRLEDRVATVRPIAGTRPRGSDELEDKRLEKELLADKKEIAEHVMLVDLGRNDLGRVCDYGSVQPAELMAIERYSHVMHIASEVRGTVLAEKTAIDVLNACFPAGTVTGAPKIRAMEIIDELEPERRGLYAGAIGYFDFAGNMDTCIAIRTMVLKDQMAYLQAGAGIVADSVPEVEYTETVNKAQAMMRACLADEER